MKRIWLVSFLIIIVLAAAAIITVQAIAGPGESQAGKAGVQQSDTGYIVLGWNNLGMHCYNPDYSRLAILPPYNTLIAQVIKLGDPPQIVTTGVTVEYTFPDNTYSSGVPTKQDKTNFWDFVDVLFGVDLEPDVGLKGKGLAGYMDLAPDGAYFIAEGIPLTEFRDSDTSYWERYPYQTAELTVRDAETEAVLATLTVVAPVSSEFSCANCHASGMDATTRYPITVTDSVDQNILAIHDYLNAGNYATYLADRPDLLAKTPLSDENNQPILCASCHGDNALSLPVVGDIKNLSNAMHGHHNPTNAPDITADTDGCYNCHPGPDTKCLRDTMSQNFAVSCVNCHGDITQVAANPTPWLNEPKCGNPGCHGAAYDTAVPLFQKAMGHGGVYCEGCHDSTHAVATSRETNDTLKFIQLQGHAGSLRDCTVCHATLPTDMFTHMGVQIIPQPFKSFLPAVAR